MKGTIEGFMPGGWSSPPPAAPEPVPAPAPPVDWLSRMKACTACACRAEAKQVVPGVGPANARLLIIGQNPGEEEDRAGQPFIGAGGRELDAWLAVLGLDRKKVAVTNIVRCHTTANRVPKAKEIKTCRDLWLPEDLAHLPQVQVLIPLGKPAVTAVLGNSAPPMTPMMAHHYRIRTLGRELHVLPLPHPAYLLRVRHLAPMFRETVLMHVRMTMEAEMPEAYQWSR